MGGTFDPIHHGHLVAASEVAAQFALDEVVFVPTGTPWQKQARDVTTAEHRYLMAVIATASNPRFTVSRVDIDRPGADLHGRHPHRPAGPARRRTSSCSSSPAPTRWPRSSPGRTPRSSSPSRTSSASPGPGTTLTDDGLPADRVSLLEVPAMAISSTDCRDRVTPGRAGLVPRARRRRAVRRQAPPLPGAAMSGRPPPAPERPTRWPDVDVAEAAGGRAGHRPRGRAGTTAPEPDRSRPGADPRRPSRRPRPPGRRSSRRRVDVVARRDRAAERAARRRVPRRRG